MDITEYLQHNITDMSKKLLELEAESKRIADGTEQLRGAIAYAQALYASIAEQRKIDAEQRKAEDSERASDVEHVGVNLSN